MLGTIFDRIAQLVVTLFFMSFAVFTLIGLMPGDPLDGSPAIQASPPIWWRSCAASMASISR
jgi:ABC-type dipeptide/oligopeptide/nickel transport system permease component